MHLRELPAMRARTPMDHAKASNERLRMDIVSDRLINGRWFPVLNFIEQYTPEFFLLLVDQSVAGEKVAKGLGKGPSGIFGTLIDCRGQ
ncbi:hypothetical protein [Candidatus Nitrospira neomarina]|uniref:Uncharacterized protein n=1 Tax=Candidatus Nitrospira neomarina TaxID=3020899 RepID=A0AA96JXK6_9BACT|nr:hypothetical protein [Candidatus Nitrospira neomarina]WNM64002.1 hypothetical protein PQG83_09670 [Candidatus Nitrospira neomarina]